MDQLIILLEKSYTSNDNQDLKELLNIFLSFCNDPNFYQTLLLIFQNETIESNIKFAGLIYFKNIIHQRWPNLPSPIHQIILDMFLNTIIHLHEPCFISHTMEISDLLIDKNLQNIKWSDYIYQFIENDPISSLILARSLIYQYQRGDITEVTNNVLCYIFTQFQSNPQNPIFLKISLKIIRYSFQFFQYNDQQLITLIQFIIENFIPDNITQYIKIFIKIAKIKPYLIYEIESPLISNIIEFINVPKISIQFFSMVATFSKDEKLWEFFNNNNFIQLFIPFFSFDENEIQNPIQFITDHFFDSFSSNSDPNSAAFRCLEIISQNNESVILHILEILKKEFENPSNRIYSISHITSAVLKNLFLTKFNQLAIELFNFVFQFIQSESVLIRCGVLIILRFENFLDFQIEEHVLKCIELIFDPNELIQFFSLNFLLYNLPKFNDASILHNFQADSVVSKILEVSQKFESPKLTDLLHFLFRDQRCLSQIVPHLIEIVNSTFSFAQFYSELNENSMPVSISSVFNSILTIILNLKDFEPSIEFEICKLSFVNSIQIVSQALLLPVLEVIFTSLCISPQPFDEMWISFEILLNFLNESKPLSNELIFSCLAVTVFRDRDGFDSHSDLIGNTVTTVIKDYDVNEFSLFITVLIKLNFLNEDILSTLICKIFLAWENDGLDFSDYVLQLLTVLFESHSQIFIEIFNEKLSDFLNDLIESIENKLNMMLIFPFIFQFLSDEQKSFCVSFVDSENNGFPDGENKGCFSLPRFSIFSDSEIVENYQKFISFLANS